MTDNKQSKPTSSASASSETAKDAKNEKASSPAQSPMSDKKAEAKSAKSPSKATSESAGKAIGKSNSSASAAGRASTSQNTAQNTAQNQKQKSAKTGALWFFTFINFLLILGASAAGYWFYMQYEGAQGERGNDIAAVETQVSKQLQASNSAIDSLQTDINEAIRDSEQNTKQAMDTLLAQVLENSEASTSLKRQLAEVSGRRPSDWLLAEANYLVNLAGRKLYLEQDIRSSITLLQEADARLQDLSDPALLPIRALIASDVQRLKQVNPVSTTSIALAISGLLPQVGQLPLENLKLPEADSQENNELSSEVSDWQENLKATWRAIVGDFISIKRVDKPLSPYLAERQQWLIEQQLKHALTQAQSAALAEHYTLYQTALQQAMALIIEHYQIEQSSVDQFMDALTQLQNTNFERQYPNKLMSVDALKDASERRLERQFNNSPALVPNTNNDAQPSDNSNPNMDGIDNGGTNSTDQSQTDGEGASIL